jgi:hypothetical protein
MKQRKPRLEDYIGPQVYKDFGDALIILCVTERQKHGILQEPKSNDCEWLPCQHSCPILKLPTL